MSVELRPLSLGEILDRAAQLYRSHFGLFFGTAIFPLVVSHSILLMATIASHYLRMHGEHRLAASFTTGAGAVLERSVLVLLSSISLAAVSLLVFNLHHGQPVSIVEAYRQVRPRWKRCAGIRVRTGIYSWVAPTALGIVLCVAMVLTSKVLGLGRVERGFLIIAVVVLVYAAGIWISMRYAFSIPSSIIENLDARTAIKRSVWLTENGRRRIFITDLMIVVLSFASRYALDVPLRIAGFTPWKPFATMQFSAVLMSQLTTFVVSSLLAPVYGIAVTLFYYDERIRKEGFDIEWMMQRANLRGPEEPPATLAIEPLPPDVALG